VQNEKKVALPARGRLSSSRAERQKQRWFKRALRWRAGCEATISTLKHPFSMVRALYIRRARISALRRLERDYQESVLDRPFEGGQKEKSRKMRSDLPVR
jgi:hypothetical protein